MASEIITQLTRTPCASATVLVLCHIPPQRSEVTLFHLPCTWRNVPGVHGPWISERLDIGQQNRSCTTTLRKIATSKVAEGVVVDDNMLQPVTVQR